MADRLTSGQRLTANQSLTSNDGRFTLVMQGDGNLVLYGPGGRYRWDTGTWGRPVQQVAMRSDGNLVLSSPSLGIVWDSKTVGNPGASLVLQDDGNLVIYRSNGTAAWASNTAIIRSVVPGFLPSRNGLHFPNSFPHIPHLTIPTGTVNVPIGDAANGLCGGMVYTVRDYFQAGLPSPQMHSPPTSGPLYDHIVHRLYMSFEIPFGPYRYLHLMNPTLPDHETDFSRLGLAPHGRAWEMIVAEWPRIRADLDAGRLAPMALVQVKTHDALQMGENHQVLAYGYELDLNDLQLFIYDPNYPDDDWIVLRLDIGRSAAHDRGELLTQDGWERHDLVLLPRRVHVLAPAGGLLAGRLAVADVGVARRRPQLLARRLLVGVGPAGRLRPRHGQRALAQVVRRRLVRLGVARW